MKLHRVLVEAIPVLVKKIHQEALPADVVLSLHFKKNPQWGRRDRNFVAEAVFDLIRYYRYYATLTDSKENYWLHTSAWIYLKHKEIITFNSFPIVSGSETEHRVKQLALDPAIVWSYPEWMWTRGMKELGETHWMREAEQLNRPARVFLRVNTLKATPEKLQHSLFQEGVEIEPFADLQNAFELKKRSPIFKTKTFEKGWFEIQDVGSQLIVPFCGVKPKQTVVDVCAGAGGKTLHLAALMNNTGQIFAGDVHEKKLAELKKRARRAGAQNIQIVLWDEKNTLNNALTDRADVVLIDAPCSGTGVFKRHPETKWRLDEEGLERLIQVQQNILQNHAALLKKGGHLVYSTCSIFKSENEDQVRRFISMRSDFILEAEHTVSPSFGGDGFYMARMKRV